MADPFAQEAIRQGLVKAIEPPIDKIGATQKAAESADKAESGKPSGPCKICPKYVIVIDPGHGGKKNAKYETPGSFNNATSNTGVLEKNLTLKYSKSLRDILNGKEMKAYAASKNVSYEVYLTREGDTGMGWGKRIAIGADKKADVFLSIHFNGSANKKVIGTETYYKDKVNKPQQNLSDDKKLAIAVVNAAYKGLRSIGLKSRNRGAKPDTLTRSKTIGGLRDLKVKGLGTKKIAKSSLWEVEFITNRSVEKALITGGKATQNMRVINTEVAKAIIRVIK